MVRFIPLLELAIPDFLPLEAPHMGCVSHLGKKQSRCSEDRAQPPRAYRVPLRTDERIMPAIALEQRPERRPQIQRAIATSRTQVSGTLHQPFSLSHKRPLRPAQGYLFPTLQGATRRAYARRDETPGKSTGTRRRPSSAY